MKKWILLLSIVVLFDFTIIGQRIYFCNDYTLNGEPIGTNTRVSCPAEGGYIFFLYQNGGSNLSMGDYFIHVDKLAGDNYVPFDVKTITADPGKNWFVYEYQFLTAGEYRISVKDPLNIEKARDYLGLVPEESTSSSFEFDEFDSNDPTSIFYYSGSTVEASNDINTVTGEIPASYVSFAIHATLGGIVYFKVSNNGKSLQTNQFVAIIEKKDGTGEYVAFDTKFYEHADKYATWGYFYYNFFSEGEYNLSVYTESLVLINTVSIVLSYNQ